MYLLWRSRGGFKGTNVPYCRLFCHDLSKIFSTLLIGVRLTGEYHRFKRHHLCLEVGIYPELCLEGGEFISDELTCWFSEAYLDWASARLTKPDKQLDAIQTAEEVHKGFVEVAKAYYRKYGYK